MELIHRQMTCVIFVHTCNNLVHDIRQKMSQVGQIGKPKGINKPIPF